MLPYSLAPLLAPPAAAAIARVLARGGARTQPPRGEVTAVRTMTLDGFDEIDAAWTPILKAHGYHLDLHAVFCHSRPQVRYPRVPSPFAPAKPVPDARCELADLLIVADCYDPAAARVDRRAVLVQAKLLKRGAIRPSGKEWLQHELLTWLPTFQFVEPDYDPRPRQLAGAPLIGDPDYTAEYGGIDLAARVPEWRQWLPRTSAPGFAGDIDFGRFLALMITGDAGCSREAVEGGNDDWSYTVDELLRVTGAKPIVKSSPLVARRNSNYLGLIIDTAQPGGPMAYAPHASIGGGDRGDDDGGDDIDIGEEWPIGPISVVHMTFAGLDERPRD